MTKYIVEVWEAYKKLVTVEADNEEAAEDKAEWLWNQDKIEFDYEDEFSNSEFICIGEVKE